MEGEVKASEWGLKAEGTLRAVASENKAGRADILAGCVVNAVTASRSHREFSGGCPSWLHFP